MKKLYFIHLIIILIISGCSKNEKKLPEPTIPDELFVSEQEKSDIALREKYKISDDVFRIYTRDGGSDTTFISGEINEGGVRNLWIGFSVKDAPIKHYTKYKIPNNDVKLNGFIHQIKFLNEQYYIGTSFPSEETPKNGATAYLLTTFNNDTGNWHHHLISEGLLESNLQKWFGSHILFTNYNFGLLSDNGLCYIMDQNLNIISNDLIEPSVFREIQEKSGVFISDNEYVYGSVFANQLYITIKSTIPIPLEADKPWEEGALTYIKADWAFDIFEDPDFELVSKISYIDKEIVSIEFQEGKIKADIDAIWWIEKSKDEYEKITIKETRFIDPKTGKQM